MGWVQTDHDFGMHYAILTVSIRELVGCRIRDALTKDQMLRTTAPSIHDPIQLEVALEEIIRHSRPDLIGGSLVSISMHGGMQYQIMYQHPSLPAVPMHEQPQHLPLIPRGPDGEPVELKDKHQWLFSGMKVTAEQERELKRYLDDHQIRRNLGVDPGSPKGDRTGSIIVKQNHDIQYADFSLPDQPTPKANMDGLVQHMNQDPE